MEVPFLDLKRQYQEIKKEIDVAVGRVIDSQFFILGKELEGFENSFAAYLGSKHSVGVASGTDALILALRALNIGPGDEVITTPFSFIATTLAITEAGATPVFVDIDPDTYQIDTSKIESAITSKTKAILPVHLYGAPCDIEKIVALASAHDLFVIEDACQAHGAKVNGKPVGTFGTIGVFSFYPGKNLGAYGDGGALCTDDEKIYQKLLQLRNYGQSVKYYHDEIGRNSRLAEIQAAVLDVKLKYLDEWNASRQVLANSYRAALPAAKFQKILPGTESCCHLLVIEVSKREELMKALSQNGVHTLIHYPVPIHLQKCYSGLQYKKGDFPICEAVAEKILSLPLFAELKKEEVDYAASELKKLSLI